MEPSVQSDSLVYENDSVRLKFSLQPSLIAFKLTNKLDQGIKINWDEVSMSVNGVSYRIVHKETGTYKISDVQPPTTIPPHSFMTDGLLPTDKIQFFHNIFNGASGVITSDLFPQTDYGSKRTVAYINSLKGAVVIVYMPLYFGNNFSSKAFKITINDIVKGNRLY